MASKSAPNATAEEPAAKKLKLDGEDKAVDVESRENEKDAPADGRIVFKGIAGFEIQETTLNVIQSMGGRVLMSMTEGGMQYLIAGARANVALSAGRYMYEVKIIEALMPSDGTLYGTRPPAPKQMVRIGFSTAGSSLILGDGADSFYFDSEGGYFADQKSTPRVCSRFGRDSTIAVLLNLDPKSPNANTVSVFLNGVRSSEPMPVPEAFRGKPLFPHVCYRNVTVHVNFGPRPLRSLPFACRMVQGAAASDLTMSKVVAPKDGKYDVLFPVGFPDEGTFDWVDGFLAKNPQYVELSDRKIIEWAQKSGLQNKGPRGPASNDKPSYSFGLPMMDDCSVGRVISMVAPLQPRHYVVMEVRQNLVAAERKAAVRKFPTRTFKRTACVVMGEPNSEHKQRVKHKLLAAKQAKLDEAWKKARAEKEKLRAQARKIKELSERRKKFEDEKKAAAEAKKKSEEENRSTEETEDGDAMQGAKEKKGEEVAAAKAGENPAEAEQGEEKEEEDDAEPEQAVLTEEEDKISFIKAATPDLAPQIVDKFFAQFSIPHEDEGFDALKFEWADRQASEQYLRSWVVERKRTTRVERLTPSVWFWTKSAEWAKLLVDWQAKQKAAVEAGPVRKGDEENADEPPEVDIAAVANICDTGDGEPLFLDFAPEDWMLCSLRYELFILATAFKKDMDDPDRVSIPEQHVPFYYSKYFRKPLNTKLYGKEDLKDLVGLVKDTVVLDSGMFSSQLAEDAPFEELVRLAEACRRERQRRADAGDETARLPFTAPPSAALGQKLSDKGGDKGRDGGGKSFMGKGCIKGGRHGKR